MLSAVTTLNRTTITHEQLAKTIHHSLVRPELTEADVVPCHAGLAGGLLRGTDVAVGAVIGFPHGAHTTATKVFEAQGEQKVLAYKLAEAAGRILWRRPRALHPAAQRWTTCG